MRRPMLVLAATLVSAVGAMAATASAATSSTPFTTCRDAPAFGCAHLVVPLDPAGVIPGTVSLAIRRKLAATGTATEAVVALVGGPGAAAIPDANFIAQWMAPALTSRDLIISDQRGTGDSGALKCPALNKINESVSLVIPDCAKEIGATRGLYTTDDSVYDLEQLRKALGYTKLVLFGTSYGVKVALRYAAEYPQNVSALVLDSTVLPNGPDVFDQASFQAVPRILAQLCSAHACPGITNPVGDLRRVLARTSRHAATATFYDGKGKPTAIAITAAVISDVLVSGDEDPVLRADFPAAIHAAAAGHYGLLAILVDHTLFGGVVSSNSVDNPLYFATKCEELAFPWTRGSAPAVRKQQALSAAAAMPAGTFGPFSYKTAVSQSVAPICAYWPFASAAPEPAVTALPNVPTLIISGADDLRTPTSNAQTLANMIPDAKVVVVPQTGHSVLGTEPGTCALDAVTAFFGGQTIQTTCAPHSVPGYLQPAHPVPSSLASLSPLGGRGTAGRTARAVELTLQWAAREFSASLIDTLYGAYDPSYNHGLGGLHGGYARTRTSTTSRKVSLGFHSFSYVAGVTVSGSLGSGVGRLEIAGGRAAAGTIVATTPNSFSGTLGGVHIHFTIGNAGTTTLTASAGR